MLFSTRDIDALRLICWCQCIAANDLLSIFSKTELDNLAYLRLIKRREKSGAYISTGAGRSFLHEVLGGNLPELTLSYHESAIQRRLRLSRLSLTAYRAGIDLFTLATSDLVRSPTLFLSAISRSRGSNPWGSTRIAGLAHLGGLTCALHYVCPGIGRIALADELATFSNQTAHLKDLTRAMLFAGESYVGILEELEQPKEECDGKLSSYGDAYRCLQMPVHLVSCDATGAVQLRLMALPDYRRRLTVAALQEQFTPPPKDLPGCDALFRGVPFLMAADMDLRRIDTVIQRARKRGFKKIAMAALEGQAEAILYARYRDTGKARVYTLTKEALAAALGTTSFLCIPERKAYMTERGEIVDVPLIQRS